MNVVKSIGGFMLALVVFPILGIAWLGCVTYAGCVELWARFRELWLSFSDTTYMPNIGYDGVVRCRRERVLAYESVALGDWASAIRHWKKAGSLYDIESMYKLGECFEDGKGVSANLGAANEYYSMAARYGVTEANKACERLREHRFPSRQRREFAKTMWS